MGYITNFIVYTLAMVGVIVVALLVCKNATSVGSGKASKYLKVLDTISLGQRKNLYIVSTGKEQFLIAGDVNNTCLISKLSGLGGENQVVNIGSSALAEVGSVEIKPNETKKPCFAAKIGGGKSFQETLSSLPKQNYMDKSVLGIQSSILSEKSGSSVIKNIADILTK